ncbi:hypothetical protein FJZ39_04420 [Candidatus Saccharibacteria bacterium]|nr:hypothetical protein [Candidatus Saccharibacteria bacterium]
MSATALLPSVILYTAAASVVVFAVSLFPSVDAQVQSEVPIEAGALSAEKQAKITQDCTRLQATLTQLNANDALTRVNVGQDYEVVASRLMAPFNSRVALNRLDSVQLATITSRYETARQAFSSRYQIYDQSLRSLQQIDCTSEPAEFYAELLTARESRRAVNESVGALNGLIDEYRTAAAGVFTQEDSTPANAEDKSA